MTVFSVKAIKPAYLKVDQVRLAILNALRAEGKEQVKLLEQTTQFWQSDKPKFESAISLSGGDAMLLVGPGGSGSGARKWQYLNEGTSAHWIYPRRAKMLRFRPGYTSGSTPGTLTTRPSRTYGDYVFARQAFVKGIKARGWLVVLQKQRYKPFRERMNAAVKAGLQRGGW